MESSVDAPPVDGDEGTSVGSGTAGVRLEGVTKRFGTFEAVKNMDLELSLIHI